MNRTINACKANYKIEYICILYTHTRRNTLTLVVEAIYPVDGGALVIPSQQEKVLWVFNLVSQQQADGLQRLLPSVHIVPQKQVVTLRGVSTVLKQPEQVIVLTVNIT